MLKEHLKKFNIILGSGSPRRQQFLKDLGVDFTIKLREVNEQFPDSLKASDITDFLVKLKSDEFNELNVNDILITADTIVWFEGKAIGKPENKGEAIDTLKKLSGKKHEVITSVCFKTHNSIKIINDKTDVYFNELSSYDIDYYVNNFKPYDKAGGYGIQEWIGFIGVRKIDGSYFNVMGLPVHKLYAELLKF